jgi:hypothetical protein
LQYSHGKLLRTDALSVSRDCLALVLNLGSINSVWCKPLSVTCRGKSKQIQF